MRTHLRSNVVGYVALFFALSLGTAWAVQKNAIKSKHIAPGHVREADLGNGAVTGDKLAADSVTGDKVVDDSLKGADVDESSLDLPEPPAPPEIPTTLPPSGGAGGDLRGAYPNPQVSEGSLAAGGDLTGSLANAQIGANTVGTNEVASLTLDEVALETGTFTDNLVSLPANSCNFTGASLIGSVPGAERVIANSSGTGAYGASGALLIAGSHIDPGQQPIIKVCNVSGAAIDPPSETFVYAVFG